MATDWVWNEPSSEEVQVMRSKLVIPLIVELLDELTQALYECEPCPKLGLERTRAGHLLAELKQKVLKGSVEYRKQPERAPER